jgi:putative thioredoxin
LTQAISSDPSNVRVALDMAQIFLDIGEIEQAQSLFDRLPEVALEFSIIFLNEKQGFYATLNIMLRK